MTAARKFFGNPVANSAALADEITTLIAGGAVQAAAATRLVNLGTLELYRTWRWQKAHDICSSYLARLMERGLGEPEDVGSVTLNIVRLDAAVGDFDAAVARLRDLLPHTAAHPSICREVMNAALACGRADAPSVTAAFGLAGRESDLVLAHTEVATTGRTALKPATGTTNLADLWGLEILLLSALFEQDRTAAIRLTTDAVGSALDGTAGVGALMAVDRAASTFDRAELRKVREDVLLAQVAHLVSVAAGEMGLDSLRFRASALVLRAGGVITDPELLLRDAAAACLPRDLARLALALREHGPLVLADEACRLLAPLALSPNPVELQNAGVSSVASPAWDGLTDGGRRAVERLAHSLAELVATVA